MLSVSMCVESVSDDDTKYVGGRMRDPLFTGLSKAVADAGLTSSAEEALLYIIPAFARCGLLPGKDLFPDKFGSLVNPLQG